ncbi:MAG: tRNA (adenosine(37)-N6)-threonylcarbamoyltransferase complex dimerization subunit type 1 TsaB [Lentisphaerae bacterium RIFOXYB12_FULL_65_16]|nr:MAG: tRNA (adenosine(37)-N6)-threonylcarbamoyltransferase complex dimerization subunit type 1 TsaB [Lentisphaerae bacterium RIFOXYA12_64_32]OGV88973.1 MAG: tRNA (adenosine(37)-N6)-threonylcarbamoyltransferase complex dimerization subunit type 1 TsaB [Lentisphaerae bacterium RIFOXYB12_FULL_65_16]
MIPAANNLLGNGMLCAVDNSFPCPTPVASPPPGDGVCAALDTSCGAAFAVRNPTGDVEHGYLPLQGRDSDRNLVPWLLDLLARAGISSPATVPRWTVGTGPGSFSGLRVGIAFIEGVCAVSGALYRGLPSSLAAAAALTDITQPGERIGVLHDARRGQVIFSCYLRTPAGFQAVAAATVLAPEELEDSAGCCHFLVSPHAATVTPLVPEALRNRVHAIERIDARHLLATPGWPWTTTPREGNSSCEPVYVRPAVFVDPRPASPLATGQLPPL